MKYRWKIEGRNKYGTTFCGKQVYPQASKNVAYECMGKAITEYTAAGSVITKAYIESVAE